MAFLGALVAMHWDLGALIGNIGTGPEIMLGSKTIRFRPGYTLCFIVYRTAKVHRSANGA